MVASTFLIGYTLQSFLVDGWLVSVGKFPVFIIAIRFETGNLYRLKISTLHAMAK